MFRQPDQVREPAYSEEQEPRELAGSCCTFKCMISRVKQQLGGQIYITLLRTLPEGTLASAVRGFSYRNSPPIRCVCTPPLPLPTYPLVLAPPT